MGKQQNTSFQSCGRFYFVFVLLLSMLPGVESVAQSAPKVGRSAAAKYLEPATKEIGPPVSARSGPTDGFLYLMAGPYISSASYAWKGGDKRTGVAKNSYSITYLFDHWGSIDTNIRIDFNEFVLDDDKVTKMTLMPLWTFPMIETRFPLYFGFGAGLGVFFKQIQDESNLSLDYQLVSGLRFPELFENAGFVFEFGLKNHLHLLSDGQLNATSLTVGALFSF